MAYQFDFGPVWAQHAQLIAGVQNTVEFTILAAVSGLAVSIAGVLLRTCGVRPLENVVRFYVEAIRNTPFVVQLFFLYFSLPMMRIEIDANTAALIALVANFSGYGIEILRAGVRSIPKGQIEAAQALGMSSLQIFRKIVLFPAIGAVYPALVGQLVLLFLNTSVVSVISAEELSAAVSNIQSLTFRSFESYTVAALIYLALAMALRTFFAGVYWWTFQRGRGSRA
jgi:polar amino acid transport system permease protein